MDWIAQELAARERTPEWNPWASIQPFSAAELAQAFIEALYDSEGWEHDEKDMRRMVGKLEGWLQAAYDQGRWEQGCADLARIKDQEALLQAHATPLSAALRDAS